MKKKQVKKKQLYFIKEEKKWTPIRGIIIYIIMTIWSAIPFLNIFLWKEIAKDVDKDGFFNDIFYDIIKVKVRIYEK